MEVFLVELARQLREKGWRTIHVVSGEPGDFFRSELASLDSPYIVAKFPLSFARALSLGKQLRRYRPDVIQTTFLSIFDPAVRVVKIVSGAPRLIITDQSSGLASDKKGPKRLLARVRGALAGRYVTQIIAVSDFVRKRDIGAAYIPPGKIRRIYNGIQPLEPATRQPHEKITIAFAGQLIPEKGVHLLLRAIKDLSQQNTPTFHVLIAGQGPSQEELCRYCQLNGLTQVEFLGQIDCVPKLYQSADIVVAPSQWEEAFGFSIAEAMSSGACMVASSAGGIPEVIGTDGTAGLIFEKSNAAALARILRELIHDPQRRMAIGNAAHKRATELFPLSRMVDEYAEVFDEIAPSVPARRVEVARTGEIEDH